MPQEHFDTACAQCSSAASVVHYDTSGFVAYFCTQHEPELTGNRLRFTAEQLPTGRGELRFRAADIGRIVETGKPIGWAKDTGTYLGVWGSDGLLDRADAYTTDGLCLDDSVNGSDGDLFDTIWETTRDICGGDDFLEQPVEIPPQPARALWLVMDVDSESYSMRWE